MNLADLERIARSAGERTGDPAVADLATVIERTISLRR